MAIDSDVAPPMPVGEYRAAQRIVPGIDALYAIMRAIFDATLVDSTRVLIVGAGGGRELETLSASTRGYFFTAVDPSVAMLDLARRYGPLDRTEFVAGTVDAVAPTERFDAATSLLVMHFLADDGAKADYLASIRRRLCTGAPFLIADVSYEPQGFERLRAAFLTHGVEQGFERCRLAGAADMIAQLPTVGDARACELFAAAEFARVTPVWQSLWYRGWAMHAA